MNYTEDDDTPLDVFEAIALYMAVGLLLTFTFVFALVTGLWLLQKIF